MRHFQPGVALLMIVTWTATAAGQSKQEVDGALDKAVETSQAAKKAQMAADDAKADAKKKQTELDMLKDQKKKLEEKLDQSMTISRLEKEIEELKKKLEIIDKVAQKVINGMINPGTKTTYTPDEQAVRTEALGGNTVPTVPDSIRKVFADKKAELEKQLKEKTEQLEKAKKDADKKLTDDERKDAQGQVAALDEKIKAKEAELAAAKAKATAAATAAKTAKEADQAAYAEFDKLRKAKKKEDDIAQAKKELEEALKGLRVASQSLKDRERELTQNLSIPGAVANLFRFIDDLLNVFGKISDALSVIKIDTNFNNPDLTNALSQGAKALDALEKILKDPKSTISRLIQLQLEDYYKNLKKWLNKVKAAKRKLEQLTAAGQGAKKLAMAPGKRRTMLKSPYLALTKNTATQLYAATEHALDRGSMEELSRIEASVGEYRDDALNGGNGFDQIDVSQSTMLANLIDEVQAHHASLAEQVAGIEGGVLPQTDLSELNSASHPHFSSGLRSITWEAFGDDLLRQRTAMTTAGAVVLKGNATSTMGAGPPTLTLSLSPRADDGGPEKTVNVEVADNGEFEVEIAPGWNPTQIRLGGPNTSTTILDDPLGAGLPGLPPWRNPALPPDAQRNVLLTFDRFERIVSTTLTGQAPRNGPPNEAAAIRGWRILGVVRGGDPPLDQMPNLEIWLNNTALDESLFADLADAVDENQVVNLNNNTPAVTAVSDAPPGGGETVTLVPFSGDLSTKPTTLSPIAERVTVIQQVAVLEDSEEMADALDLVAQQTLQKVRDHVQNVVGAGGKVVVTEVDRQNNQAPKSLTGDASFTFQINATNATGAPQPIDRGALQANLDGDDSLLAAGVALPREAQAAPADPYFKSKGSWGEEYHDQWALRRAGFVTPAGAGVWPEKLTPCTVAVIGGGVDWTHSDLAGQMWINEAEDPYNGIDDDNNGYVDDVFGWNFRDETNNVLDLGGHDTHIAGVIAARWNGRAMAGANPSARIMALKVANFLGQADSVSVSRAIYYAANHGARVINISYNGKTPSAIEQRAIQYASQRGALVVVSSGNQGADSASMALAGDPHVLTVAGSDTKDQRARFSNFGHPIDITAPAMDVLGLRARGTDFLLYTGENPNYSAGAAVVGESRTLYRASGTSFAAPLAAGAASLLFSQRPELSGAQVRRMLLMSADEIGEPGWDQNTGAGRLNVGRALRQSPDEYLLVRILKIAAARRNNQVVVQVHGDLSATSPAIERTLQVAFGKSPADDDWKTISTSRAAWKNGDLLGVVPATQFNKRGVWSIRVVATDANGVIRQARGAINIQ